ncbi:MAG: molybdenum cofactor guanylyltransferase MobA [Pseudomonadota bacterium]
MNPQDIVTGLILCGGRGSRMGNVDKGLQNFRNAPLALHALMRLGPQVNNVMINANRNLSAYEGFGVPVILDSRADYPGPLAGFEAGLAQCQTEYLLTVPCDVPFLPADLAERLLNAALLADKPIAYPITGKQPQPVFCLMRTDMLHSLTKFMDKGERKIDIWTAQGGCVEVPFDDCPQAFENANTLEELRALEKAAP